MLIWTILLAGRTEVQQAMPIFLHFHAVLT